MAWFLGIDIGSGSSKGAIVKDGKLQVYHVMPSGFNYRKVSEELRQELLAKAGLTPEDIAYTVLTGQGAPGVPFGNQQVSDILCCAKGIYSLFPAARTVIDVGEQSSQVLRLSETGQVINFVVSERCAAGSGRFLRIIANVLRVELDEIGPLSLKSKSPVTFTTECAVFGESEAISRVAEGAAIEDILAGVHNALAHKISGLIDRVGLQKECAISGGGGFNVGLIKSIEDRLGLKLLVPPQPQIVSALGAALLAEEKAKLIATPDIQK